MSTAHGSKERKRRRYACEDAPDLFFAVSSAQAERAKALCQGCPIQRDCLESALQRREPWGVWGGQVLQDGAVVPTKRGPGRPRKTGIAA